MNKNKIYACMSKLAIATMIATSLASTVYAANGDLWMNNEKKGTTMDVVKSSQKRMHLIQNRNDYTYELDGKLYKVMEVDGVFKQNSDTDQNTVYDIIKANLQEVGAIPTEDKELKVESVSAINAKEVKVVFNKAVNKDSAEIVSNYTLATSASGAAINAVELQKDGKSVIVQLTTALDNGDTYKVDVENVLDTDYNKMAKFEDKVKVFVDNEAPKLLSAEYKAGTIVLYFDEPVVTDMTVKVDGATVNVASVGNKIGEYTVTTNAVALEEGTHDVVVYGAKDAVATPNKATLLSTTVTVAKDTAAPAVESLKADTSNSFKVKFNRPLKTTATDIDDIELVVKKGNTVLNDVATISIAVDTEDTTNTTYIVTIADKANTLNPLYGKDETSVALNVSISKYQAENDLFGKPFTGKVTLNLDKNAPKVVSEKLNTVDGQTLKIKFDKALDSSKLDDSKVLVTLDGVRKSLDGTTPLALDATGKILEIKLAVTSLENGVYTVQLEPGAVMDLNRNKNNPITTTVDNTVSVGSLTIAAPTTSGTINANEAGVATNDVNIITVNYGEEMDASAVDKDNYKLDGKALPAGTKVYFEGDTKVVKIELPKEIFKVDGKALLTISKNVKTEDGSKIVQTADKKECNILVDVADNVAPKLVSAEFVLANATDTSTKDIKLTFNEGLSAETIDIDDFAIYVDGVEVSVASVAGVTAGDKTITITAETEINISQNVEVKVVPVGKDNASMSVKDEAGNELVGGVTSKVVTK